jgi:hypothetical protein
MTFTTILWCFLTLTDRQTCVDTSFRTFYSIICIVRRVGSGPYFYTIVFLMGPFPYLYTIVFLIRNTTPQPHLRLVRYYPTLSLPIAWTKDKLLTTGRSSMSLINKPSSVDVPSIPPLKCFGGRGKKRKTQQDRLHRDRRGSRHSMISLLEVDTLMCRSISRLSILVSIHFFPNYLITMTVHITLQR